MARSCLSVARAVAHSIAGEVMEIASAGSVVALVTVVTMRVYRAAYGQSEVDAYAGLLAIGAGLSVGVVCGGLNGLIITRLRLSPFVATLGMYSMARGAAYWVSGRQV